jgi:hypothetical protein
MIRLLRLWALLILLFFARWRLRRCASEVRALRAAHRVCVDRAEALPPGDRRGFAFARIYLDTYRLHDAEWEREKAQVRVEVLRRRIDLDVRARCPRGP